MNRHHHGRHRDNRRPSRNWPMVFSIQGQWVRSGDPSRYDAHPILDAPHLPWRYGEPMADYQMFGAAHRYTHPGRDDETDAA